MSGTPSTRVHRHRPNSTRRQAFDLESNRHIRMARRCSWGLQPSRFITRWIAPGSSNLSYRALPGRVSPVSD